ncbi:MAG: helix-turn-helix domain-containing protein, partial [Betaproteobacteria bacterium]|nr:helix-turn-helix domain-containing protein [Betaproteobacteria bacterium]
LALLERSDRAIKQIAAAVGFRNEKSFIRAFKLWTGQTPAAWRRQRQGHSAATA